MNKITRPSPAPIGSRAVRVASVLVAAIAMTACGGGGGADPVSPSPSYAPVPYERIPIPRVYVRPVSDSSAPDSTIVKSSLPTTYQPGTPEKGAWDLLQSHRGKCGFGLLAQDTRLDLANAAHADYMSQETASTGILMLTHTEENTKPFFTGVNGWDRAWYQGFPRTMSAGEIISGYYSSSPFTSSEALGQMAMEGLINTVYHLRIAMLPGHYGGVGSKIMTKAPSTYFYFGSLISSDPAPQMLGKGYIATFPCEGISGVPGAFDPSRESPNPFPKLPTGQTVGTPIFLRADSGQTLSVTAWKIQETITGAEVPATVMNSANDPASYITGNEAFIVPSSALSDGRSYTVSVEGAVDETPFKRVFSFKTK